MPTRSAHAWRERTLVEEDIVCLVAFSRTVVTFLYTLASMKTCIYPCTYVLWTTHICARVPLEYRTNYIRSIYSASRLFSRMHVRIYVYLYTRVWYRLYDWPCSVKFLGNSFDSLVILNSYFSFSSLFFLIPWANSHFYIETSYNSTGIK